MACTLRKLAPLPLILLCACACFGQGRLSGRVTDKEGTPIREEKPVFDRDDLFQEPLGGTREQGSHKGDGLALMEKSSVVVAAVTVRLTEVECVDGGELYSPVIVTPNVPVAAAAVVDMVSVEV